MLHTFDLFPVDGQRISTWIKRARAWFNAVWKHSCRLSYLNNSFSPWSYPQGHALPGGLLCLADDIISRARERNSEIVVDLDDIFTTITPASRTGESRIPNPLAQRTRINRTIFSLFVSLLIMNIALKTMHKARTVQDSGREWERERWKLQRPHKVALKWENDKHILYSSGHKPFQGLPNSLKGNIHHQQRRWGMGRRMRKDYHSSKARWALACREGNGSQNSNNKVHLWVFPSMYISANSLHAHNFLFFKILLPKHVPRWSPYEFYLKYLACFSNKLCI